MARWIVDGMNVIGSRAGGWWKDRHGAINAFAEELRMHVATSGDDVTVVFDGRRFPGAPPSGGGLEILFAPGGPNAADDEIARLVQADERPQTLRVVTSDRDLAMRCQAAEAVVIGAREMDRFMEAP